MYDKEKIYQLLKQAFKKPIKLLDWQGYFYL